jgi:hypothetical protein
LRREKEEGRGRSEAGRDDAESSRSFLLALRVAWRVKEDAAYASEDDDTSAAVVLRGAGERDANVGRARDEG